jgi:hypothetical protein
MSEFVNLVRQAAIHVENGRTPMDILDYAMTELGELAEEIIIAGGRSYKAPGKDGVAGEAIDLAVCLVDLAFITASGDLDNPYGLQMTIKEAFEAHLIDDTRAELHQIIRLIGSISADIERHALSIGQIRRAVFSCIQIIRRELPSSDEKALCEMARPKLEKWVAKSEEWSHA